MCEGADCGGCDCGGCDCGDCGGCDCGDCGGCDCDCGDCCNCDDCCGDCQSCCHSVGKIFDSCCEFVCGCCKCDCKCDDCCECSEDKSCWDYLCSWSCWYAWTEGCCDNSTNTSVHRRRRDRQYEDYVLHSELSNTVVNSQPSSNGGQHPNPDFPVKFSQEDGTGPTYAHASPNGEITSSVINSQPMFPVQFPSVHGSSPTEPPPAYNDVVTLQPARLKGPDESAI